MSQSRSAHRHARMNSAVPAKRLPAFGKALLEMRRAGQVPSPPEIFVCLDSWEWWCTRARCVVADDVDPSALDYSFCAGLDVSVAFSPFITNTERRDALLKALVRANPLRLLAMDMDSRSRSFLVKSVAVGVELQEYA